MNFNYFISKLPDSVIRRAFEIFFSNYDYSGRNWHKEINLALIKMVDHHG